MERQLEGMKMGFRLDGQGDYLLDEEEAAKEERLLRGFRSHDGDTEDSVPLSLDDDPNEMKLLQGRGMRDPALHEMPIEDESGGGNDIVIRDSTSPTSPPSPKVKQKSYLDKILAKYGY